MRGGEYDEPLDEFIEVFTSSDELLSVLESCFEPFEAKKVLCELFRVNTGMECFMVVITSLVPRPFPHHKIRRRKKKKGEEGFFLCQIL